MADYAAKSTWVSYKDVVIGGQWLYRVGYIRDARGVIKLRIAKCKMKADGSLTQVQKLNIKQRERWELIKALVDEAFEIGPPE